MEEIRVSPDYNWFRSTVPLKRIIVDDDDSKVWSLYDAGPKTIRCPIIFLPPVSGTAEVFFQQILALTGWGYRVISLQYPVYWDLLEFCDGFRKLLDHLQLDKVHLFGASLGGFLAQKFAEVTHKSPRVHSLILCNSFSDTSIFNQTWTANSFWLMPAFMLKKIVLGNFAKGPVDPKMADAIDFMVDRLESLNQSELASRLTLNCQNSYVEPHKIKDVAVTIMDVFDQSALSNEAKEEMYKLYPNARRAHLKTGGNFPYLCRSAEVNLYIQWSGPTKSAPRKDNRVMGAQDWTWMLMEDPPHNLQDLMDLLLMWCLGGRYHSRTPSEILWCPWLEGSELLWQLKGDLQNVI
ncbi:maspardin isoform X1 [Salminus brasiliensis]|uniref:maspardin isoform X1 n=1 Tax=Salminus brasiliensis TaxID=930266 RepID=UPI003B83754D